MALFSFGGKKKKEVGAPGNPMEQIIALKQQNKPNDQIIHELEKQGYNSSQIFDALNQANLTNQNMPLEQPPQQGVPPSQQGMPPPPQDFSFGQPPQFPEQPPQPAPQESSIDKEKIEEIAEAIIDEKWKEFEEDVKKIIDWKEETTIKIGNLDQQIKDVAGSLNTLHKNVLNKISEYDSNITDVGTEIKAMEKVFQKVLPSLTENVNKLERMAKGSNKLKKK